VYYPANSVIAIPARQGLMHMKVLFFGKTAELQYNWRNMLKYARAIFVFKAAMYYRIGWFKQHQLSPAVKYPNFQIQERIPRHHTLSSHEHGAFSNLTRS
jgi:hypothetical protein